MTRENIYCKHKVRVNIPAKRLGLVCDGEKTCCNLKIVFANLNNDYHSSHKTIVYNV